MKSRILSTIAMSAVRATPCLFVTVFAVANAATCCRSVSADLYTRCPDGLEYEGLIWATARARSLLACAVLCSRDSRCQALNVFPNTTLPEWVTCVFLANQNPGLCVAGLTKKEGLYMYKEVAGKVPAVATTTITTTPTTTPENNVTCENGGRYDASSFRCWCLMEFAGTRCERRIRDCADAVENGGRNDTTSSFAVLHIQPINVSTPFLVRCYLGQIGVTVILVRNGAYPSNINWTTAQNWFGEDLLKDPLASADFFVGLQNLHLLTSQATYDLSITMRFDEPAGDVFVDFLYTSSTVGTESASYELSYQAYNALNTSVGNGFSGTPPILFSTPDHDNNGCAGMRGHAGWFGSDCVGNSPFAPDFLWPRNGGEQDVLSVEMKLVKNSPYVIN